jgi:hypothetical protein
MLEPVGYDKEKDREPEAGAARSQQEPGAAPASGLRHGKPQRFTAKRMQLSSGSAADEWRGPGDRVPRSGRHRGPAVRVAGQRLGER